MNCKPETLQGGLLTSEAALNPRKHREKLAEIMLEQFRVPKYFVQCQALNSLYSEGLTTALVVDCGEGLSTCVPVVDGYLNSSAISRLDVGGREVNFHLMKLLSSKALFTTTYEQSFVQDIKELLCWVKKDDSQQFVPQKYMLPDGKSLLIEEEQYRAPELLFDTSLIGREGQGI